MQTLDSMHMLLLVGLFAVVFGAVFAAMLLFSPRDMRRRIEQAGGANLPISEPGSMPTGSAWLEKLAEISQPISKLSIPVEGWENSALRVQMMNAGWRTQGAAALYFTAKTLLALALPLIALAWLANTPLAAQKYMSMALLALLGGIGYYLPNFVLTRRIAWRKRAIFEDFPDALDLLTVCVEAGLSLDAALVKVAAEIELRSPVVASELQLMLLEMRSGFTKEKALRNLSLRTGVEDVDSFCTMLVQAERFGTSIGSSLRVLSDTLRTRRRMRAEEQASKIALKLLFPLIFCIFPALLTVLLGPAFIHIYRILLPTLSGG
ncbi:type II secretion system F family protein [Paraburkholderia panacisoli]|jgi:tight adherence protein C|uniref:Type II secretion system F family protein n=1 Tax=Paraburkholderia panacisoli TaxID=2603818 RepID=A0A5B0HHS0_9BURK|nr:type II secretion system F family protein [Paraburkholderia panacisoli]KAA1014413.1 type II secretion system F family protein [Paraburkholderia panacisoli]